MRAKLAVLIGIAAACTTATVVRAADLDPYAPPTYASPDPQLEFGTGWYLRGDVGWSENSQPEIFADIPAAPSTQDFNAGAGFGYRWTPWFRTDLTVNFDGYKKVNASSDAITCPYALHGLTTQGDNPVELGYLWSDQTGTCVPREHASLSQGDLMASGYVDLGTWSGLTPYVGAGAGLSRIQSSGTLDYYKSSDGKVYAADLTTTGTYPVIWINESGTELKPQPVVPSTGKPVAFGPQTWGKSFSRTRYNFAWSLMGGVAYAVDDHLSLDVGYRYVNLGSYTSLPGQNAATGVTKTLTSQQVRVGLRYAID